MKDAVLHFHVDRKRKARWQKEAKRDGRSLTSFIEQACDEYAFTAQRRRELVVSALDAQRVDSPTRRRKVRSTVGKVAAVGKVARKRAGVGKVGARGGDSGRLPAKE